jgi:DNA polymerase-1
MRIIKTQDLSPDTMPTTETEKLWIYNGLDCCITYEILDKLLPQLRPETRATYDFSRSLQGTILEMNTRGLRVDEDRRQSLLRQYRTETIQLSEQLNRIICEGVGFQFEISPNRKHDWPSDQQLCKLFYDYMGIPAIFKLTDEGERRLTVDRKALEKLEGYFYAEPIVRHLYTLREHGKKTSFLSSSIDGDGRLRTNFNIAGTTTGRLASSFSDFGTGTNLQNVENRLRSVFISDPGYKFCNIDLEQSDARVCGAIHWNLFRDARYLDLCESGDLHTGVSRIAFPQIKWTNNRHLDREIANGRFYREFSYRDASKRLGHGTNYQGEPPKMARETHIPVGDIERFQRAYLPNFAFERWWEWVANQVKSSGVITTMLGRRRKFFGHPKDPDTIRAAIAYEPQSVTADTINRGMLAVWLGNRVQLLLQVHDSILFQFPEEQEDEIVPWALGLVQQQMVLKGGREFMIPAEAKVGWNWSDDRNDPDALRKWPEKERRTRVRG